MPAFLNNHAKARTRSVQLDRVSSSVAWHGHFVPATFSPFSTARTDLLLNRENQVPPVRNYGSMLNVDAPKLLALKPMAYEELYDHGSLAAHGTI